MEMNKRNKYAKAKRQEVRNAFNVKLQVATFTAIEFISELRSTDYEKIKRIEFETCKRIAIRQLRKIKV